MDSEQLGLEAQRFLDSPAGQWIINGIQNDIIQKMKDVPIRDVEGAEWLRHHLIIAAQFENMLRGFAQAGRFETANRKESVVSRFKRSIA